MAQLTGRRCLGTLATGGHGEGFIPFMECKAFYPLFDMTSSGCGNLWLAKGSHKRPKADLDALTAACQQPEGAVEMRLPAGAAVLWRTAVWHCVGPQTSNIIRKIIHIGYHHRWLRPTDYTQQATALLARSSPVRRQLLGAMPEGHDPMGSHGDADWAPASKYWQPHEDDVPLRAEAKRWAQASEATARL
jgi:ectoine hydroxylase-related dioxygenase (phytanoyl-CoA dioxygenase family)